MKVRLARTSSDFESAYKLRYDAYVAHGDMPPNESHLFKDDLDEQPHSYLFLLFEDDTEKKLIGTARCLVSDGLQPLGGMGLFSLELDTLFKNGEVGPDSPVMEITRVAICDEYRVSIQAISVLFSALSEFSKTLKAIYLVAPVRAKQMKPYKMLAGLATISEEKYCPKQQVSLYLMCSLTEHTRKKVESNFKLGGGVVTTDSIAEHLFSFTTSAAQPASASTPG